ncbi:hypothetical protein ACA910_012274 [Epithemia clementina (nom. ined.)]
MVVLFTAISLWSSTSWSSSSLSSSSTTTSWLPQLLWEEENKDGEEEGFRHDRINDAPILPRKNYYKPNDLDNQPPSEKQDTTTSQTRHRPPQTTPTTTEPKKTKHNSSSSFRSSRTTGNAPKTNHDHPEEDDDQEDQDDHDDDIRLWGCHLTQFPLVFVHIGKAGGGSIRRQIAAAAWNVTRNLADPHQWAHNDLDQSYYYIHHYHYHHDNHHNNNDRAILSSSSSFHHHNNNNHNDTRDPRLTSSLLGPTATKATFCNSGRFQHMPLAHHRTYEGTLRCSAQTMLGQALACPEYVLVGKEQANPYCGGSFRFHDASAANVVYVGHNDVGNEIHWLPAPYFQSWWQQVQVPFLFKELVAWASHNNTSPKQKQQQQQQQQELESYTHWISQQWQGLDGIHPTWFRNETRPICREYDYRDDNQTILLNCIQQPDQLQHQDAWAQQVDEVSYRILNLTLPKNHNNNHNHNATAWDRGRAWSQFYAQLPVLRVVMIREPFSWLASKYAWHNLSEAGAVCDNVAWATAGAGHSNIYQQVVKHVLLQKEREQRQQRQQKEQQERNQANNNTTRKRTARNGTSTTSTTTTTTTKYNNIGEIEKSGAAPGWVTRFALNHIYQLCGSDCRTRHLKRRADLPELVAQAQANLRHAFVVVGIYEHGCDEFYQSLGRRVAYLSNITTGSSSSSSSSTQPSTNATNAATTTNTRRMMMKRIHEQVQREHSTQGKDEDCKQRLMHDDAFRQALQQASPELMALIHLYQVAKQVNAVQQHELQTNPDCQWVPPQPPR